MLKRSILMSIFVGLACCAGQRCPGQEAANEAPANVEATVESEVQAVTAPTAAAADYDALDSDFFTTVTFQNPLGIEVIAVDSALRAQLGLAEECGVVVAGVIADSAVAQAGLQAYDIVLELDDSAVGSPDAFQELIAQRQGATVRFDLLRQGHPVTVEATLEEMPQYIKAYQPRVALNAGGALLYSRDADGTMRVWDLDYFQPDGVDSPQYRIGVTLSEADDTLRSQLRLAAGEGLVVTDVVADSPAAVAGIRPHDVLTMLDGRRLSAVDAINAQIQEIQERSVTVILFRGGEELSLEIAPQLTSATETIVHADLEYFTRLTTTFDRRMQGFPVWNYIVAEPTAEAAAPNAAAPDAAAQLAELKKQVEALQATLQALEAAMQSASAAEQAPPTEEAPAAP